MRVKISFTNPSNRAAQNVLLAIPEHLKYIIDLEVFLIDKLKLGKYLEQTKKGTLVKINGYILPKTEKIKELVSEDDLIRYNQSYQFTFSLEFTDSKRKAEKNIENDIDDIVTSDINQNEESRDRNFLKMLEEVTLLRRLYHKMKNKYFFFTLCYFSSEPVIDNEIKKSSLQALPIVSKKIVEHQSDSEKEEEKIIINKKAPTNARKSKVIEYNSSDMDSSEEEVPVVKKKEY